MEKTTTIEVITPEIARLYLGKNTSNRILSKQRIIEYTEQMRSGRWKLSNDAICFDIDGTLINGQHRLLALIEYGMPLEFLVGRGYDKDSFYIMDTGKNRSTGDSFYISGVKNSTNTAAAIKKQMSLRKGLSVLSGAGESMKRTRMNNQQLFEEYEKNKGIYDVIINESQVIYHACRSLGQSEIAGIMSFLVIDMHKPYEKVEDFFSGICSLKESNNSTIECMRMKLLKDMMCNKKMSPLYKQGLIMKCWNFYNSGKQVKQLIYDVEKDKDVWFE